MTMTWQEESDWHTRHVRRLRVGAAASGVAITLAIAHLLLSWSVWMLVASWVSLAGTWAVLARYWWSLHRHRPGCRLHTVVASKDKAA